MRVFDNSDGVWRMVKRILRHMGECVRGFGRSMREFGTPFRGMGEVVVLIVHESSEVVRTPHDSVRIHEDWGRRSLKRWTVSQQ